MLLIPFLKKPDWRRPPWATIFIILANLLVFAGLQARDEATVDQHQKFYSSSQLGRIELPLYAQYLTAQERHREARRIQRAIAETRWQWFANHAMERDEAFMRALRAKEIVRPEHADFALWWTERAKLDGLSAQLFTERFLFKPNSPSLGTAFTHMFLHGSWGHLIGNMLVLAMTAYIVEEVLGRKLFLPFYLLTGLGAVGFYWLFHQGSSVGLLGASGAVSGVMGLYAVLFGWRRIDFFVSLIFYFDVRRMPALLMLPVWLANEIFQLVYSGGRVAYHAHIGGLLAGALLAAVFRWRRVHAIDDYHEEVYAPEREKERRLARLQQARGHSLKLDFDRALAVYEAMLREHADDREVMGLAYRTARHRPESEAYHQAAARILDLTGPDAPTAALVHQTYLEYFQLARPSARLSLAQWQHLARRFCEDGFLADAERIVGALLKRRDPSPETPALLLLLARALERAGKGEAAKRWRAELEGRFQGSAEAGLARQWSGVSS